LKCCRATVECWKNFELDKGMKVMRGEESALGLKRKGEGVWKTEHRERASEEIRREGDVLLS